MYLTNEKLAELKHIHMECFNNEDLTVGLREQSLDVLSLLAFIDFLSDELADAQRHFKNCDCNCR